MSDEDKYKKLVEEIREIYVFLTEKEPTPDDEIEAREKLIDKFKILKDLNFVSGKESLISDIINKLENWDTLELWFKEVEGLPESIKEFLGATEVKSEVQAKIELEDIAKVENIEKAAISESTGTEVKKESTLPPELDINKIVEQVSSKFKGEISSLKSQIEKLQKELEMKEKVLKEGEKQVSKAPKIAPKGKPSKPKKSKLPPPQIKIPVIKKPQIKPKPKVAAKSPEPKESRPISESIKQTPIEAPQIKPVGVKISEIKPVSIESPKIQPVSVEKPVIQPIEAKKPKIEPVVSGKPKIQPVTTSKPKIEPVVAEKPKIQPVTTAKPKIEPVMAEKPKIQPVSPAKPIIEPVVAEKPKIEPVSPAKPKIEAFTVEMPKIEPIKVEEINSEVIKPKGADLFNVFSSIGDKTHNISAPSVEAVEPIEVKKPKKRGERKRKRGERPGIKVTQPSFAEFGAPSPEVAGSDDFMTGEMGLPADKDALYQELIALEGRRYSLEKNYKELETSYQKGDINDFDYKAKTDELKYKLNEITERINTIRRIISNL
ncbi:MAG: hypothetical protein ACTSQS_14130 [Promethearchaeota archaeon]